MKSFIFILTMMLAYFGFSALSNAQEKLGSAKEGRPIQKKSSSTEAGENASNSGDQCQSRGRMGLATSDAQVISGISTAVIAAAVALFGWMVTKSYNQHNIRLQEYQQQTQRAQASRETVIKERAEARLNQEAELATKHREIEQRRLEVETIIKAVGLLGTQAGEEVSESQRVGALFALARLGHLEFALTLLEPMWPRDRVDANSAVWLVDKGLLSEDVRLQDDSAAILKRNANKLVTESGGYHWPSSADWKWNTKWSIDTRDALLKALIGLLPNTSVSQWNLDSLNGVFANFLYISECDSDAGIKEGACRAANVVFEVLVNKHNLTEVTVVRNGEGVYRKVEDLRQMLQDMVGAFDEKETYDASATVISGVERLKQWADE